MEKSLLLKSSNFDFDVDSDCVDDFFYDMRKRRNIVKFKKKLHV